MKRFNFTFVFRIKLVTYFVDFSNCENKENWCEAAQPNCNTDVAKDGCQKYCGICKSKD